MRTRVERRNLTKRKLQQRAKMIKDYGLQGGSLYDKHTQKIENSLGYMRDGNVSHFVKVGFRKYTKNSSTHQRYGSRHLYTRHDQRQILRERDY